MTITIKDAASWPSITSVVNAGSFLPGLTPASFATLFGLNLAGSTATWDSAILEGKFPVELNGVRVRFGGKECYLNCVSPTQVNFLLPPDVSPGIVEVELTSGGASVKAQAVVATVAPAFYGYRLDGRFYVAALFSGTATLVARVGSLGVPSRPAVAGDYLELYATGLGPTAESVPPGQVLPKPYPVQDMSQITVTIGGIPATVLYAGMTYAGVYQLNLQVPSGVPEGDAEVVVDITGRRSQSGAWLTFGK